MQCEFCDIGFPDLASTRRHMLSVAHIRAKQSFDLLRPKFVERMRQKTLHPKDFYELTKLINIHSKEDVRALKGENFFSIEKERQSQIACELFKVLHQNMIEYRIGLMPEQVRQPFLEAIERRTRQEDHESHS